jgi:hypothetical protein|tara:strand:+ start:1916 stop:2365 length:450 start_codon:yes stop_codon:yes gene_type:complete
MKELFTHLNGTMKSERSFIKINGDTLKSLLLLLALTALLLMTSCGRVETPEQFFDITGVQGDSGYIGSDGIDGNKGIDGSFEGDFEFVEVCPQYTGANMETLVLLNGQYLAFFSSGAERLSILDEGVNYRTTDGRGIDFSIENGIIICE